MKALLVTPENEIQVLDKEFDLKTIQSYIGGWIEVVNFGPDNPHFFAYIDEEGKLKGLPVNETVTDFWYNSGQRVMLGDVIVGNVLFFGQVDDEGNDTEVPQDVIDFFMEIKNEKV
jgi:hypothetical protein